MCRVERDCSEWAHGQIRTRLQGLKASRPGLSVTITDPSKVEGDVTVTQRKGKLRHNFDLAIVFDWVAEGDEGSEKGSVEIRDWMSDTSASAFEFYVKAASSKEPVSTSVKSFLQSALRDTVWATLQEFTTDLVDEHGKHLIVPSDSIQASSSGTAQEDHCTTAASAPVSGSIVSPQDHQSVKTWKETVEFTAPPREIFKSLVEPDRVQLWSRGSLDGSLKDAGATFGLYGRAVSGRVETCDWDKVELQLSWRLSAWPAGHYSTVHITLHDDGRGGTRLQLKQTGIPSDAFESTSTNWATYYWNPVKTVFGCGAVPFK